MRGEGEEAQRRSADGRLNVLRLIYMFWIISILSEKEPLERDRTGLRSRGERQFGSQIASNSSVLEQQLLEEDREQLDKMKRLEAALNLTEHLHEGNPPANVTGAFQGSWFRSAGTTAQPALEAALLSKGTRAHVSVHSAVLVNSNFTPPAGELGFHANEGQFNLELTSKASAVAGLQEVEGKFRLMDGPRRSVRDVLATVSGFYLEKQGELALYLSTGFKSKHVAIDSFLPRDFGNGSAAVEDRTWDTEVHMQEKGGFKPKVYDPFKTTPSCFMQLKFAVQEAEKAMILIDGELGSPNCNFTLSAKANARASVDLFVRKAINFALVETLLTILQMLALLRQFLHNQPFISQVSMLSIGMMAVLDLGYVFAILRSGAYVPNLFNSFVITLFLKLILVTVFEMRLVLHLIMRSRFPQESASPDGMRRQQDLVLFRVYMSALFSLFVVYMLDVYKPFWLLAFSFWWPQVWINIANDTFRLDMRFLVWSSFSRLFAPLYIYGCPDGVANTLFDTLDPVFCAVLVFWTMLQLGVLGMQRVFGPRAFIPKRFLPKKYDYNRKIPETLRDSDCAICMIPVSGVDIEHMLTPCNHLFHRDCLRQWLLQKHQCPTCRATLPPV